MPIPGLPPRPGTLALRTLVLLRHASAQDKQRGREDAERQLTSQGEQEARQVAARLAGRKVQPDVVVSSPAPRARRTAELVCEGLRIEPGGILLDPAAYETDAKGLQALVERHGAQTATLLVVGHNPSLEDLVAQLGSTEPDWRLEAAHAAILRVPPPGRLRSARLEAIVGPQG